MNYKSYSYYFLGLFISLFVYSCNNPKEVKEIVSEETQKSVNKSEILLEYLKKTGDFINNKKVPAMIKTEEVFKNLDKYLIIDLRKKEDFVSGHIKGAKNVEMKNLLSFLEKDVTPSEFKKIVMVCYSGQSASYSASVLRLLSYENVYAMKWGMSSWDKASAEKKWASKISNKYANKLETKSNPKNAKGDYPVIETEKTTGNDILEERAAKVLSEGFKKFIVKADDVFASPEKYYIINYWPKEKYDLGHIPGSVQYDPKKSLGTATFLNTLPTDKPILVYCYTGQHASFVAAYLRILNYDARVLVYGANGFMNGEMVKRDAKKWHAFTKKKILNYKLEK